MIEVLNKYHIENEFLGFEFVSIMRKESVLGNPFPLSKYSRKESLRRYRLWLWARIKDRGAVYKELIRIINLSNRSNVALVCCCKPLACHGDIIKSAIEWIVKWAS
jgi:hypothetical protein